MENITEIKEKHTGIVQNFINGTVSNHCRLLDIGLQVCYPLESQVILEMDLKKILGLNKSAILQGTISIRTDVPHMHFIRGRSYVSF